MGGNQADETAAGAEKMMMPAMPLRTAQRCAMYVKVETGTLGRQRRPVPRNIMPAVSTIDALSP